MTPATNMKRTTRNRRLRPEKAAKYTAGYSGLVLRAARR